MEWNGVDPGALDGQALCQMFGHLTHASGHCMSHIDDPGTAARPAMGRGDPECRADPYPSKWIDVTKYKTPSEWNAIGS